MKQWINKIKNSIEKNSDKWCVVAISIIFLSVLAFLYISQTKDFSFKEHLDETAMTVEDKDITLKEAAYYIMVIESNGDAVAVQYNDKDHKRYWNIYLNDGDSKSNFLNEQAEDDAISACIRDEIYYREALSKGISLDSEEEEQVKEDAYEQEKLMTGKMYEVTEYEYTDFYHIIKKIAIARKYVTTLMEQGYKEDELDYGGSYYNDIEDKYKVEINEELWEEISLGSITIN